MRLIRSFILLAAPLAVALAAGCGSDTPEGCDIVVAPSADDHATLQAALLDAKTGQTVCLEAGHYKPSGEIASTTHEITIRGVGDERTDVILDFAEQTSGANGFDVTGDGFTIEHLSLRNVRGDGVKVTGADRVTFRDLYVSWDAGSVAENGAYAIFPVQCTNVLIEGNEIVGASDAGIYVGQSSKIVVRNNVVHGNVDGFSIENSSDVEIYDNHSYDNTGGMVIFNLPNLPVQDGRRVLVRNNVFENNNRDNFGAPGAIISVMPAGTGLIILAADDVELRDNVFSGNISTGVGIISYNALPDFNSDDPNHDPFPETIYIHDNVFENNGSDPQDLLLIAGQAMLEDIVWDGYADASKPNDDGVLDLCIQNNMGADFRNMNAPNGFLDQTTDASPHDCAHTPLPAVELDMTP